MKLAKRLLLLVAALLPLAAAAQEQESWNAHLQSTYVWQAKPAFHSPYEGPNSLQGTAEHSYSWTGTANFGLRLGPGTEAYFDPEVALGVPMSGLVGLAGFPNGELAKSSGSHPTAYPARLFIRHTMGLGGGTTHVDSAANQLASDYDKRRIVLTAGLVSTLDLFDANAYAHDPRTQFMNWDLMTHAAYDYAADARGYTRGIAVEYFDDGWSARFARFAVPRLPNDLPLDPRLLRHYGDQFELARDYSVHGQTGTVRLLGFRTRAVLARYDDALARAAANGTTPDLNAVRTQEHVKYGLGVAVEHKLSEDVGLFARALRADGKTETDAFTEADASASLGLSIAGKSWKRGGDTAGLAFASGFLSPAHRAYLARGGSTVFLGEGTLAYRPERVWEIYYEASVAKDTFVSLDFQRIANPGYNADRGPVSVFGVRLHWDH
jgi:hypothetical protein